MDLAYSPEHEQFRREVRQFLQESRERWPKSLSMGRATPEYMRWQAELIERGYTARSIPREYGGHGGEPDILKSHIISEEFARTGAPRGLAGQGVSMLVPTLLALAGLRQPTGSLW